MLLDLKKSLDFKKITDERGLLTVINQIPNFLVNRLYLIEPSLGMWRGNHYHKISQQTICVLEGNFECKVTKESQIETFQIKPGDIFFQEKNVIFEFCAITEVSKLLILCDKEFDKNDYYSKEII